MTNSVPATILTGFLGSGKTTLINRILNESRGRRFALIVNEFGEIGIDGGLIKATQDFVKMDNGCLCCVLNEELDKTLGKLVNRDDYDAVILETTGIADPLPVAWSFQKPQFVHKFRLAGIVTVVDALHLDAMLAQAEETRLQIERADYLYLAKTDQCSMAQVKKVQEKLVQINSNARSVLGTDPESLDLLFDFSSEREFDKSGLAKAHDHDHSKKFQSLSLSLKGIKVDLNLLEDFFEQLPMQVFRAKAVFQGKSGKFYALHSVCGRVDFEEVPDFQGEPAAVFIGKSLDEKKLKAEFKIQIQLR